MDIDFNTVIKNFVKTFVLENQQEKVLLELKDSSKRGLFTNKLKKDWNKVLDVRLFKEQEHNAAKEVIQEKLDLNNVDLCYVISGDTEIDDKAMEFSYAFGKIQNLDVGSLIINLSASRAYLQVSTKAGWLQCFIGTKN